MPASKHAAEGASERLAYTLQEVAELLSLSYRKVRYMADSGELEVVRFGRARRVLDPVLQAYIRQQQLDQRQAS